MSEQAVSALQAVFEQFAKGEFGAVEALPDDLEVKTAPEMPDAGMYRGREAVSWLTSWMDTFESLTMEPVEFIDAGERVIVEFTQRGSPRGGSAAVELPSWAVFTMGGELSTVSRIELFMSRGQALAAAGQTE